MSFILFKVSLKTFISYVKHNSETFLSHLKYLSQNNFFQIAHVIREVRQFQQTPYKIDPIQKASDYLLDPSRMLTDDELYQRSLLIEPRSSRLSVSYPSASVTTSPLSSMSSTFRPASEK